MKFEKLLEGPYFCWARSARDKKPLQLNGAKASVTQPSTWTTYKKLKEAGKKHIGIMLHDDLGVVIIDLDDKPDKPASVEEKKYFKKLINASKSYAERSTNKRAGAHIIVKAQLDSGKRNGNIELYASERFMILTGDRLNDNDIIKNQRLVNKILKRFPHAANNGTFVSQPETHSDQTIIEQGSGASNGHKFDDLCNGEWGDYKSQSEADMALIMQLGFYTKNDEQVARLFRLSGLGQRDKAKRDNYVYPMIKKMRGMQPPRVKTPWDDEIYGNEKIKKTIKTKTTPKKKKPRKKNKYAAHLEYPPGKVGELARYFFRTAIRPIREMAIVAAFATVAGIVGRAYNVSGAGLNIYQMLLGKTGVGKEGASDGITQLFRAGREKSESFKNRLGPSEISSGQALVKNIADNPCYVTIWGEAGARMNEMCSQFAAPADKTKKRAILQLYSKSGQRKEVAGTIYADADKNVKAVWSPALSILGEGTAETYYGAVTTEQIDDGLSPRFSVLHYEGPRPPRNENPFDEPPEELVDDMVDLHLAACKLELNKQAVNCRINTEALVLLNRFDKYCDDKMNSSHNVVEDQQWNRGHLKALKYAALIAVADNHHIPTVNRQAAVWAIKFVDAEIKGVIKNVTGGAYGHGNARQEQEVRKAVDAYCKMSKEKKRSYKVPKSLLKHPSIIPFDFIRRRCSGLKCFTDERTNVVEAIRKVSIEMSDIGILNKLPQKTVYDKYRLNGVLLTKGKNW